MCFRLKDACDQAAVNYPAFGSVLPSATKPDAADVSMNVFQDWPATATTPVVAVGGVAAENCAPLVRAGVDFISVIDALRRAALHLGCGSRARIPNYGRVERLRKVHQAIRGRWAALVGRKAGSSRILRYSSPRRTLERTFPF
jgi:Thiamine monophosphate synthase